MILRCLIDDLLLPAEIQPISLALVARDGDETFILEAIEAQYYELVSATQGELVLLQQARYRLLRHAADFRTVTC